MSFEAKSFERANSSAGERRVVAVLGMQRSGASEIARALSLLGVTWRADLHSPAGDLDAADARQQALTLLAGTLGSGAGAWGFEIAGARDSIPFWKDVFSALGCSISFVVAVRNPMGLAAALARDHTMAAEKACLRWLQHTLPIVRDLAGEHAVVVDFDELHAAPYAQLQRLAERLALPSPERTQASVQEFERALLATDTQHESYSPEQLHDNRLAPPCVCELYSLLHALACDDTKQDDPATLDRIARLSTELARLAPLIGYIDGLEQLTSSLERALHDRAAAAEEMEAQIAQLQGDASTLEAELQEAMTERALLEAKNESLRQAQGATIFRGRSQPWLGRAARHAWHRAPLSIQHKHRIKNQLFTAFSFALRHTAAYRNWQSFNAPYAGTPVRRENLPAIPAARIHPQEAVFVPLLKQKPPVAKPAKLICFYLPQFHAIPENDAWWGEGFTEWTNVRPAKAQFVGHDQPKVPWELGYYDLLDPATQQRQVELAKLYGIEGFCFYFYWFGGTRLLETPTENYLRNTALDLPFCLCWANENWSRRWDGLDSEILIAQQHSADDDRAFIEHVSRYMRDARYIRIDGRPLLLVYRPSLLPDAKQTAARWREWCRNNGIGEIYLAYTQSFELANPADYGFDAAIEFPPNNSSPPNITDHVAPLSDDFGSTVYDWSIFVERSRRYQRPGYKLFRSVCPAWDNTARRKNRGTVFLNSTPALYQEWLENAIDYTQQQFANPDEQLIFVNAWNEWAEGACLEPDAKHGYAYLQATRNALTGTAANVVEAHRTIVLVTHDAYPHGAQYLALNLAKVLSGQMGFDVQLICLGDGPLKSEYAQWATLHDLAGIDPEGPQAHALAKKLYAAGIRSALVNTTVGGHFLRTLAANGFECTALIHELRGVLEQYSLHSQARAIAEHATHIVFPAAEVAESFAQVAPMAAEKVHIRPQGIYKRRDRSIERAASRKALREKLDLPADSFVVLGVGYADHRKGIDLFVEAGLALAKSNPAARWVWIGHWEQGSKARVDALLAELPAADNPFVFPGLQTDTEIFYGGADVFALTSREDPFPSVVLEALDAGLPVVGFDAAGGFIGLLREGSGELVPHEDHAAFAAAVGDLLQVPERREALGARGLQLIDERFSFRHYVFDLLDYLGQGLPRISVIVPSYNYAHYLPQRLSSIVRQDYPIFEIIFCDDRSSDDSIRVARDILAAQPIDYSIVANETNSGSVFRQWQKGVDLARGTHVWIAEADDFCSPLFLSEAMKGFDAPEVVLSYCESKQVNAAGATLADNYLDYVADVDANLWKGPFIMPALKLVEDALCIKNTIPNVSGVVFDRARLQATLAENIELISSYRVAGDWLVYVLILQTGRIAFSPRSLNMHRRHESGVTIGSFNEKQLNEIKSMQEFVATNFDIDPQKMLASRNYIEQLSRQFGLRST